MFDGLSVILTGGLSSRMGRPKACLPLYEGSRVTFLERIFGELASSTRELALVSSLPPEQLPTPVDPILQERPEEGQLSSLRLAWRRHKHEDFPWVMVLLVDHPYVKTATVESLLQATRMEPEAKVWSLSHEMHAGHPVIFSREIMEELEVSNLSEGARPVVAKNAQYRAWVETDDESILWDVDTPEDYECYSKMFREREGI